MARQKRAAAADQALNPRSDRIVLFAVRKHGELPGRDLSGADLNRLAYRRALSVDPRKRPPDRTTPETLAGLADELVAGGFYTRAGGAPEPTLEASGDPSPSQAQPADPVEASEV